MRLIDKDDLKPDYIVASTTTNTPCYRYYSEEQINNALTIDAVQVVRCKDCRWGREVCGNIECSVDCNLPPEYHGYEWYCPNGERKEDA